MLSGPITSRWRVAPSRVRGLKQATTLNVCRNPCRTLTGAWIETVPASPGAGPDVVAPSRVRGLKREILAELGIDAAVAPSRVRGLKREILTELGIDAGRTLTGAWIETR